MALKRLFGNENSQHRQPYAEDGWERAEALTPRQPETVPPTVARIKTFTIDLNVANTDAAPVVVAVAGNMVKFISSGNATDVLKFRFGETTSDTSNDPFPLFPGEPLRFPFKALMLSNAQQPAPGGGSNIATFAVLTDPGVGPRGSLVGFE